MADRNSTTCGASSVSAALKPEPEFQTWAHQHSRERQLHEAQLAQITRHHDLNPGGDATHQQQAWAQRRRRERRLHLSAIAQLRHC